MVACLLRMLLPRYGGSSGADIVRQCDVTAHEKTFTIARSSSSGTGVDISVGSYDLASKVNRMKREVVSRNPSGSERSRFPILTFVNQLLRHELPFPISIAGTEALRQSWRILTRMRCRAKRPRPKRSTCLKKCRTFAFFRQWRT